MQRNSMTRMLPPSGFIAGTLVVSSGTPTLTQLTGDAIDQDCLSVVDTGTGDFNIVVTNFKGPAGSCIGIATGTTISTMVGCTSQSYSGDTATFTFKVENDASTASDTGFNFILMAY